MIAACPKCHTRYRVQPEQLGSDGARLRCSHCHGVFRVRLPQQASSASAQRGAAPQASPASAQRGAAPQASPASAQRGAAPQASPASAQRGAAERSHQDASAPSPTSASPISAERSPRDASAPSPTSASPISTSPPPTISAPLRPIAAPDPREPGPDFDRERLVVVAHADAETSKTVAEALEQWGLQVLVAYDGVEAILSIQRTLPRVVVLDAALPKMYGFQVCEVVKRNESLRETRVVLVGAVHKEDRYRRAPSDIYGADVYVEPPDLPDALHGILTGFGVDLRGADGSLVPDPPPRPQGRYGHVARGGHPSSKEVAPFESTPASEPAEDRAAARLEATPLIPVVAPAATPAVVAAAAASAAPDPLDAERAKAERLARIIVSDIALYNPEKFAAAARSGGDALAAMHDELEEGRSLFRERIDARVRAERDHLAEELVRAAKARSAS